VIKEIDIVDLGALVRRLAEDICNGLRCGEDMSIHKVVKRPASNDGVSGKIGWQDLPIFQ
jgi:hypothetical protein